MNLGFDQYGAVQTNTDGSLYDVIEYEAELDRLHMFFDTKKGSYKFDKFFGNLSLSIFGKMYIDEFDTAEFDNTLQESLTASYLLPGATVSTEQLDPRFLETTISLGGDDIIWRFHVSKGRLVRVTTTEPELEEFAHIITAVYIRGTGRLVYNVSYVYDRCNEENSIEIDSDTLYAHRLYKVNSQVDQTGTPILDYTLNDFDRQLNLNTAVPETKWIRMELWPADRANLAAETNPYLLRR